MRTFTSLLISLVLATSSVALAQEPVELETETLETAIDAIPVPEARGTTYMFIVVVGQYDAGADSSRLNVRGSNNDLVYLMNMAVQTGLIADATYFSNEGATGSNILGGLEKTVEKMEVDDTLLVFWIGNGSRSEEHGAFFWPADVSFDGPTEFLSSVISPEDIIEIVETRPQGATAAIFLDTVHDGAYNAMAFTGPVASDFAQSDMLAFSATESATPSAPSMFSQTLIDAFYGVADRNPTNGIITADEMVNYMITEMTGKTGTRPGYTGSWDRQPIRTYDPATRKTEPTVEWTLSQADTDSIERMVSQNDSQGRMKAVRYGALGLGLGAVVTNVVLLSVGNDLKRDLNDPLERYEGADEWDRDARRYSSMRSAVPVLWSIAGASLTISGATFVITPTSAEFNFRF